MAVKIRLRRMGAKKAPFYRIVVADSRYPRDVDSSRKSVTTTLSQSLRHSRLMRKRLRSGSAMVLSQLIQLRLFSRTTISFN